MKNKLLNESVTGQLNDGRVNAAGITKVGEQIHLPEEFAKLNQKSWVNVFGEYFQYSELYLRYTNTSHVPHQYLGVIQ